MAKQTQYEFLVKWATRPDAVEGGDCWPWPFPLSTQGYGRPKPPGREKQYAHRLAYEMAVGEIPDGKVLDHLYRNRSCFRPSHLQAVTQGENNSAEGSENIMYAKSLQTECLRGHLFDDANTMLKRSKYGIRRDCRTCHNERQRRKYGKNKSRQEGGGSGC